jgi:hypothetical protein
MTDPKVAQAIADGRVPKGITAAYLNESKDAPAIVGIILVTCITSIIVLGRLASRAFLIRRFGIDDYLTLVSWVSSFLLFSVTGPHRGCRSPHWCSIVRKLTDRLALLGSIRWPVHQAHPAGFWTTF